MVSETAYWYRTPTIAGCSLQRQLSAQLVTDEILSAWRSKARLQINKMLTLGTKHTGQGKIVLRSRRVA